MGSAARAGTRGPLPTACSAVVVRAAGEWAAAARAAARSVVAGSAERLGLLQWRGGGTGGLGNNLFFARWRGRATSGEARAEALEQETTCRLEIQ